MALGEGRHRFLSSRDLLNTVGKQPGDQVTAVLEARLDRAAT